MKSDKFRFKQFEVSHHRSSMKVGTDALLLGACTQVDAKRNMLEVGCGCGVISLMLAQRNTDALITAIDIHLPSVQEASENFNASKWTNRLKACHMDFMTDFLNDKYDLIVSNPPFFIKSLPSPNESRNLARHVVAFDIEVFFSKASEQSTEKGHLVIIVPYETYTLWEQKARLAHWYLQHIWLVRDKENKDFKRVILQFGKENTTTTSTELVLKKDTSYTEAYQQLLRDFQIIFT